MSVCTCWHFIINRRNINIDVRIDWDIIMRFFNFRIFECAITVIKWHTITFTGWGGTSFLFSLNKKGIRFLRLAQHLHQPFLQLVESEKIYIYEYLVYIFYIIIIFCLLCVICIINYWLNINTLKAKCLNFVNLVQKCYFQKSFMHLFN